MTGWNHWVPLSLPNSISITIILVTCSTSMAQIRHVQPQFLLLVISAKAQAIGPISRCLENMNFFWICSWLENVKIWLLNAWMSLHPLLKMLCTHPSSKGKSNNSYLQQQLVEKICFSHIWNPFLSLSFLILYDLLLVFLLGASTVLPVSLSPGLRAVTVCALRSYLEKDYSASSLCSTLWTTSVRFPL